MQLSDYEWLPFQISDMLEKISYPTEILKSHFLDQYYAEVSL